MITEDKNLPASMSTEHTKWLVKELSLIKKKLKEKAAGPISPKSQALDNYYVIQAISEQEKKYTYTHIYSFFLQSQYNWYQNLTKKTKKKKSPFHLRT